MFTTAKSRNGQHIWMQADIHGSTSCASRCFYGLHTDLNVEIQWLIGYNGKSIRLHIWARRLGLQGRTLTKRHRRSGVASDSLCRIALQFQQAADMVRIPKSHQHFQFPSDTSRQVKNESMLRGFATSGVHVG